MHVLGSQQCCRSRVHLLYTTNEEDDDGDADDDDDGVGCWWCYMRNMREQHHNLYMRLLCMNIHATLIYVLCAYIIQTRQHTAQFTALS